MIFSSSAVKSTVQLYGSWFCSVFFMKDIMNSGSLRKKSCVKEKITWSMVSSFSCVSCCSFAGISTVMLKGKTPRYSGTIMVFCASIFLSSRCFSTVAERWYLEKLSSEKQFDLADIARREVNRIADRIFLMPSILL